MGYAGESRGDGQRHIRRSHGLRFLRPPDAFLFFESARWCGRLRSLHDDSLEVGRSPKKLGDRLARNGRWRPKPGTKENRPGSAAIACFMIGLLSLRRTGLLGPCSGDIALLHQENKYELRASRMTGWSSNEKGSNAVPLSISEPSRPALCETISAVDGSGRVRFERDLGGLAAVRAHRVVHGTRASVVTAASASASSAASLFVHSLPTIRSLMGPDARPRGSQGLKAVHSGTTLGIDTKGGPCGEMGQASCPAGESRTVHRTTGRPADGHEILPVNLT